MKSHDLHITMPPRQKSKERLREPPLQGSAHRIGKASGTAIITNIDVRFAPLSPIELELKWHQPCTEIPSPYSPADSVPLLLAALASATTIGKL